MSQVEAQTSENSEVKEAATKEETTGKETENSSEAVEVCEELVAARQIPLSFNIIKAPTVCPPGYRLDAKGKCRKIM